MSKASGIPVKRALPSKESTLFKELLQLYETRNLKKGLKTADQILKKFPEHGETMCMKGLVLTHLGKREEGIEFVKKGIRFDLTSHICWHVFGLIQKGEKNYEEALKSYTQALKFDKDNLNILRDAAQLQTQLRLYDALVETRNNLLKLRPNVRQNWVALAVAHHLNGNRKEARKILEHYERTLKNVPDYDIEHSETLLYHVQLLEELEEYTEALRILDVSAKERAIVDRTAIMEYRARLLTKLRSDEAEHAWRALVEHNSDSYDYYRGYLSNQGLSLDQPSPEALTILKEFSSQLPKAAAPKRLALTISTGDEFKELAKPYLMAGLIKGIPSLFADVKALYQDKLKEQAVEDIVTSARDEFAKASSDPSSSTAAGEPTSYLWTLYFLAQHHSYLGRPKEALAILDEALTHTPTLPELHTCKARVLKRAGDYLGGARCLNDARLLDGQDRFLNTKCGKYLLRAGMIDEANGIFGLFTKKDAVSPAVDLEDMQSLLFLVEEANAQRQNGKLNLALKTYMSISKVFDEIQDDQYDFHGYNLRKFTINIYLKLLTWEDSLRSHPAYITAAVEASKIWVAIHDDPSIVTAITSSNGLTDAEKKAKKKAKKAAQKQEETKKTSTTSTNEDKGLESTPQKDEDPEGLKLFTATDPLERADKLLLPLTSLAPNNVAVWIAIYDVAIRRKKLLLAVRALNKARALAPEHPEVHLCIIHLKQTASALPQTPPAPIGDVFSDSLLKILPSEVSLETFNSQYLQRHSMSASAIIAAAQGAHKLSAPRQEVENIVFTALNDGVDLKVPTALATIAFLISIKSPRVDEFRSACDAKFELSTVFKSSEELTSLRQRVLAGESEATTATEVIP
ncbi:NMDA receptor-regulated protein 1-domain-containing protein [Crucibulum laeve]|uniref:NMDA receptor-regulated protein 1-domain-containing protein n=1 Tax=Crucibulum laeve TaxID=68775 RepID=A0A5C3M8A8_9AGAR|nr:NMDA receptor-regulated protein 1-domain-containing protein [Crucibulum laeve]